MSLHEPRARPVKQRRSARTPAPSDAVFIRGGAFRMGSDRHYPEEAPVHSVEVADFWIDRTPVTNAQFLAFVEATGYRTVAEEPPKAEDYPGALPHMLRAGSLVFTPPDHAVDLRDITNWWSFTFGATWRRPYGRSSSIRGLYDHPVVHIAYADAEAYAAWSGKTLPTEAEWEYAARGGLDQAEFAWGDEFTPAGEHRANTWQGVFPQENLLADRFARTSPVKAFPPNGYGVLDMIGNVWEWTTDWYAPGHSGAEWARETASPCCASPPRRGAAEADSYDPCQPEIRIPRKVLKGGSHLCAPNYCRRYRPAARHPQPVDTSTSHVGFRCIVREGAMAVEVVHTPAPAGLDANALALRRTVMAANRTMMAWVRTALSMISFGFTIYKVLQGVAQIEHVHSYAARNAGLLLVGLGVVSLAAGTIEYWFTLKSLRQGRLFSFRNPTLLIAVVMWAGGTVVFFSILARFF